ncbi:MAG: winged helix-turn-helix transcriptional regulator [Verrucomicrobiae bacterium]|nr:winged helix-turn-helix transcriptional regulator [Verrucomicrobiae bacterium]MCP5533942.1 winged helix-turn-helix transcriptional regulator [Akkermansiaceae bacterium]MCP5544555.1 winged helix-turn-helix transcriptional regulator [Akkermansiaceae bacterium]MCP5547977.1 winged helix-turn-helix transcriptional regulator [Akkermansiaceae bacterium]
MKYGQFCPIAKAAEIVGERWTLLIIRELLMGTTRFSDFQRTLSQISPTLLTKRLNLLVDQGLAVRKAPQAGKRAEYHPTLATKELGPVVIGLGEWGMRWARGQMNDDELDIELLMHDLCRRMDPDKLPGGETVIHFLFSGLEDFAQWWIVIGERKRELCVAHPGKDPDVRIATDPRTMVEVYAGDLPLQDARRGGRLEVAGARLLERSVAEWLPLMAMAHVRPEAGKA